MNKTSKIISLFVSVIMAFGITAIPAFASSDGPDVNNQQLVETVPQAGEAGSLQPAGEDSNTGSDMPVIEEGPETEPPAEEDTPASPVIKVAVSGPGLQISWEGIEGCEYYELYRSYESGKKGSLLSKTAKLSYHDKATPSGKRAYYTLYAYMNDNRVICSETASGKIFRVYIETGHGINSARKWDSGCRWKKYQEAKLMIPVCRSMSKHLERNGVYAYTDAFNGNKTNLKWTLNWLNKNNKKGQISAFINVHCDYYRAPSGTLALYKTSSQKRLASCLNKGVQSKVKIRNRGLEKRKNLMTLNSSKPHCVSVLYECGNIKKDNYNLRVNYDAYGQGLAKGLCSYLGISYR